MPELKGRLAPDAVPKEERGRYHTLSGMTMLLTGCLPKVAESANWLTLRDRRHGRQDDRQGAVEPGA